MSESELTFVNGRAVEQTEKADSSMDPSEREAAIAEFRKLTGKDKAEKPAKAEEEKKDPTVEEDDDDEETREIKRKVKDPHGIEKLKKLEKEEEAEEESESPTRDANGRFLSKDSKEKPKEPKEASKEEEDDIDVSKASVKELMKARAKIAALKAKAKEEAAPDPAERQRFNKQMAELNETWEMVQRRQREIAQQEERLKMLTSNPAEAIRHLGQDPEQFILSLAQEGTPEGQMAKQLRQMQEQLRATQNWQKQQEAQWRKQQEEYQQAMIRQARDSAVEKLFRSSGSNPKFELVNHVYGGKKDILLAIADITAEQFRGISNGREADVDDILDYINDELDSAFESWYQKKVGKGGQKVQTADDEVAPAKVKGKSLSPEMSGERRALKPKDLSDLSDEERLAEAKKQVALKLKKHQQ